MSESFDKAQDKIIPAILASSVSDLESKLAELPKEIKFVHIDVLEEDIWTHMDLNFEAHLMVKEPEKIVQRWIGRGAKKIIAHKYIDLAGEAQFGLAFGLDKAVENIENADFVHLMSIAEIGEQGHPFDTKVFDRIESVKEKFPQIIISVDGGINVSNYQILENLGVDRLIVGSGFKDLWNSLMTK